MKQLLKLSFISGVLLFALVTSVFPNTNGLSTLLRKQIKTNKKIEILILSKKIAIGVVDLTDKENPQVDVINGDDMMYAASLPKIAILLAAMDHIDKGTLTLTEAVNNDMARMIRYSSNTAASRMIDRVGGVDGVNKVMMDPKYGFYNKSTGGGLWVGKPYGRSTVRKGDPLKGITHGATVRQISRFYTELATGKLISPARSAQMLKYLKSPGISHKFVYSLKQDYPISNLYRKSGSWRHYHADSVLVYGKDGQPKYVLTAIVHDQNGEKILRDLAKSVETVISLHREQSQQVADLK